MVATPIKTEIDTTEAERMLTALGIDNKKAVILCCYGETNRYFPPRKQGCKYDWQEVCKEALEGKGRDWTAINKNLENPKNKPYSRVNAADKLLEKALKFDEAHFQRIELAKVREILENSEAGRSPIIEIQSD